MRQRIFIVITLIVVVVVLVLLNAASYVKIEPTADSESSPDRSTFNAGATGTRALFDFLHESGYQVTRWREATASLLTATGPKPATVVIIGETRVAVTKAEQKELMHWVSSGGRLVLIDRTPDRKLLPDSGKWAISTHVTNFPWFDLNPNDYEQMTREVKPVIPSQPTALARDVEQVMPSRFAGSITFAARDSQTPAATPSPHSDDDDDDGSSTEGEAQPAATTSPAPVSTLADSRGSLLIDYAYGRGRIIVLSDPFIVANNGINRADNLQLAINVVAGGGGIIAFDEFHQGHASTHNALFQYFEGTPVLAICGQLALIGLAIVWSRGKRFARPLPLPRVDRRSSLEFVASMAELQQRAKAHDLALENIYGRVRRVLVRHAGLNQSSPRAQVAARVASRSKIDQKELESLMRSCEDTINGAPTTSRETLRLVRRLREIESRLGLQGRVRDAKQSAAQT
jgi:hypothetical protein